MSEKKTLGKKKSIAVSVGLAIATVAGASYVFFAGTSSSDRTALERNIENTDQRSNIGSSVVRSNVSGNIMDETMLPDDHFMVSEHREQEKRRFEQASGSLNSFISGEDQLTGFRELEELEEQAKKESEAPKRDPLEENRRIAEQARAELAQREEETKRLERERLAARSNTGQNATLVEQLEQQRRMMGEMQAQMDQLNRQLEAQKSLNSLDIENQEHINAVMGAIIAESTRTPKVRAYNFESSLNNQNTNSSGNDLIRPDGSRTNQPRFAFDTNFDINDNTQFSLDQNVSASSLNASSSAVCTADSRDCIKMHPGDTVFGLLFTQINSDDIGYSVARIVSGPLSGAQLFGQIEVNLRAKNVRMLFNKLTFKGVTYNITAIAVDPVTKRPGLADHVNNHYLERYGSLLAAGLMSSYAETLRSTETRINPTTGQETRVEGEITDEKDRWMYAIGKSLEPANREIASNFNRPPTVTVESVETGSIKQGQIGIMFVNELEIPVN